jgi:hypothetical protein
MEGSQFSYSLIKRGVLRLAYKPHSVRQGVDASLRPEGCHPCACLGGHLSEQPTRDSNEAGSLSSLLGLAPGGGYLAACIAADAGGLLHRRFTIAPKGSLFLWPCPADCSAPGFPRHRALWSADFPRPFAEARGRDRPASLKTTSSYRLSGSESILGANKKLRSNITSSR